MHSHPEAISMRLTRKHHYSAAIADLRRLGDRRPGLHRDPGRPHRTPGTAAAARAAREDRRDPPGHGGELPEGRVVTAPLATATLADCFEQFEFTTHRIEALPAYDVPAEAEALSAFREGGLRDLPERSVRTNPWLANIQRTTAAGKT